jgi:hypothetical protein
MSDEKTPIYCRRVRTEERWCHRCQHWCVTECVCDSEGHGCEWIGVLMKER